MNEAEKRLLALLTEKLSSMAGEIHNLTKRVQFLEEKLGETQHLTQKVDNMVAQFKQKRDEQANANIPSSLRIHGVPYVEGEKLKHIFNNLCLSLNHTPAPAIKEIYRMNLNKNLRHSIVDPIIMVKLELVRPF
ncbi:GL10330 [Drosophila persimilis]|uniref:GL10330 n=1 Tax=Drosophila persimilis TaxID=7234 RepID=B4HC49_DROPE|nr:GL10330 [Drosophila persimilis]